MLFNVTVLRSYVILTYVCIKVMTVIYVQTSDEVVYEVAIVGAGPAGATCGYYLGILFDVTHLTC